MMRTCTAQVQKDCGIQFMQGTARIYRAESLPGTDSFADGPHRQRGRLHISGSLRSKGAEIANTFKK